MGLNRIVNQLFEGVTFGLKIIKHLLVTDGNKNNWSQTSPRSKINSRGENVKKKKINGNVQWWSTNFYFLWKIFYIGIIVSFPQAKGIYLACHFTQGNRWTLVRDFTVFECLRLRMHKVDWNRVGEWEQVFKLKSQRHNMNKRDFL